MFTPYRLGLLLLVAVGGPYVASETEVGRDAVRSMTNLLRSGRNGSTLTSQPYGGAADYASHAHYEVESLRRNAPERFRYDESIVRKLGGLPAEADAKPGLVGAPITDLREVMRFDITPDWVTNRFARVSTVLGELNLKALRVPVVTGIKADDIAGTLTYYFDGSGRLQRLTIHGFTGDPARLIKTMTEQYGLQSEPSLEAGVFTKRWNAMPVHFLRLTHAPVVYADAVHQKYTVFLELNQPNLAYGISPEAKKIVAADRSTGRW